ncbi:MAG: ATP synthase F0 subunit B [Candidatus Brocadiae bacterium]|nr:ATP synthase F0 subunit B [Candidatus Brocadiia bacterium]
MDLLKTLGLNPLIVLIQMGGFLLTYFILRALLWKPVGDVIDRRAGEWKASEAEIDRTKEEGEALRADYAARMAVIERQAYDRLTALVREGVSSRADALVRAQEAAAKQVLEAQAEIRAERDRALREAGPSVDALARQAAARVMGGRE